MNAFLTGSRAYGEPRPDSDVDLVIQCDESTAKLLMKLSEDTGAIKFGQLNILACTTKAEYRAWAKGTEECVWHHPTPRWRAIEIFDKWRAKFKVKAGYRATK